MGRKTPFTATSSRSCENIVFCLQGLMTSQGQTDLLHPYFPDAWFSQGLFNCDTPQHLLLFFGLCAPCFLVLKFYSSHLYRLVSSIFHINSIKYALQRNSGRKSLWYDSLQLTSNQLHYIPLNVESVMVVKPYTSQCREVK